jgi:hypothetical protein
VKHLFLCISVVLLLLGCKGGDDNTLTEVVEKSSRIAENGTLRVKIDDGTVRFYGADTPDIYLKATKRAYSAARLQGLNVQLISHNDSVTIEAVSPPKAKWSLADRSGTIDCTIIVPQYLKNIEAELINGEISIDELRGGNARASVRNGRISARNCFAHVDYVAQNGAIDFYYTWWQAGTYLVKAAIPNGSIGVFVPRGASFQVDAETGGGSITGNLINGDDEPHEHRKKLVLDIGAGPGPTFQLKSGNGNIRLHGF